MNWTARYTPDEAIRRFGDPSDATVLLDGRVAVLPDLVLYFLTGQSDTEELHMETPRTVTWRRKDAPMTVEPFAWLPLEARGGTPGAAARRHHLLLRASTADSLFIDAGRAHLGSYGSDHTACFSLDHPVSRDVWLAFGGYSGWRLSACHSHETFATGDDRRVQSLVESALSLTRGHFVLTRYEDDALHVYTNEHRAWLMYLRDPSDPGLYLAASAADETAIETFACGCGIPLEFPAHRTTSKDNALAIVMDYYRLGSIAATRVAWTDDQ